MYVNPIFPINIYWILAEKSRNSGANTDDTSALYQLAIKSAQEQGFIHFMALGFELFLQSSG